MLLGESGREGVKLLLGVGNFLQVFQNSSKRAGGMQPLVVTIEGVVGEAARNLLQGFNQTALPIKIARASLIMFEAF